MTNLIGKDDRWEERRASEVRWWSSTKEGVMLIPLKVVWSRVFPFNVRAEGADIPGTLVHQSVTDHLVFPLEAFTAFAAQTALDGTEVCTNGAVNVFM
jgi:hypothetical protein